jgi:hypothetical protein
MQYLHNIEPGFIGNVHGTRDYMENSTESPLENGTCAKSNDLMFASAQFTAILDKYDPGDM